MVGEVARRFPQEGRDVMTMKGLSTADVIPTCSPVVYWGAATLVSENIQARPAGTKGYNMNCSSIDYLLFICDYHLVQFLKI